MTTKPFSLSSFPKIGIRPSIDGRYGGVWEPLEGQNMAIARAASEVISSLQVAEGHTVELPESIHSALCDRTNPTSRTTWFAPVLTGCGVFRSAYEGVNHWGANYSVMTCGHVGHLYLTLASNFRIPVYMHNVNKDRMFRLRCPRWHWRMQQRRITAGHITETEHHRRRSIHPVSPCYNCRTRLILTINQTQNERKMK